MFIAEIFLCRHMFYIVSYMSSCCLNNSICTNLYGSLNNTLPGQKLIYILDTNYMYDAMCPYGFCNTTRRSEGVWQSGGFFVLEES